MDKPRKHCAKKKQVRHKRVNMYDFTYMRYLSSTQSCLTLCDSVDCSAPGFPVHHQLTESVQTHVHQVSDAIPPSHPLSPPSPPAFDLAQ